MPSEERNVVLPAPAGAPAPSPSEHQAAILAWHGVARSKSGLIAWATGGDARRRRSRLAWSGSTGRGLAWRCTREAAPVLSAGCAPATIFLSPYPRCPTAINSRSRGVRSGLNKYRTSPLGVKPKRCRRGECRAESDPRLKRGGPRRPWRHQATRAPGPNSARPRPDRSILFLATRHSNRQSHARGTLDQPSVSSDLHPCRRQTAVAGTQTLARVTDLGGTGQRSFPYPGNEQGCEIRSGRRGGGCHRAFARGVRMAPSAAGRGTQ